MLSIISHLTCHRRLTKISSYQKILFAYVLYNSYFSGAGGRYVNCLVKLVNQLVLPSQGRLYSLSPHLLPCRLILLIR